MKNRSRHLVWMVFIFLLVVTGSMVTPSYGLEILLEPATVQRAVGGKARVRVYATSAEDLISMGVKVSFNPGVVQVQSAVKYEDFDNGWVMDADGNASTTNDQYKLPLVEIDNSGGRVAMMGGRLIGEDTTGLDGKVLLGIVDFVAVGNGSSNLNVDLFAYHPNHPTQRFANFVKLDGTVTEPVNVPANLGFVYVGNDACECNLNFDTACNILDYQLFIQSWGKTTCHEPTTFCACDLNNDGSCNILDYQVFIQHWGSSTCTVAP
jgi:hypothetical protein